MAAKKVSTLVQINTDVLSAMTYEATKVWKPLHHKCDTCMHFARDLKVFETGECHRHPPLTFFDPEAKEVRTKFPIVANTNFCGEHKETQAAKDLRYKGV